MKISPPKFRGYLFMALSAFAILFTSCSDNISETQPQEQEQEAEVILSLESYLQELDSSPYESELTYVDDFNGKTVADFHREWKSQDATRMNACGDPPTGCVETPMSGTAYVGSCQFGYSYDLYDCGFGNVAIFNFQYWKIGGFCFAYEFLVEQNLADGDLLQYQEGYNAFASRILLQIENELLPTIYTPNGAVVFATYLPNICSVQCTAPGKREVCGEDCCLRFSVSQNGERSADVWSFGLCDGTTGECENGNQGPCDSVGCRHLDYAGK